MAQAEKAKLTPRRAEQGIQGRPGKGEDSGQRPQSQSHPDTCSSSSRRKNGAKTAPGPEAPKVSSAGSKTGVLYIGTHMGRARRTGGLGGKKMKCFAIQPGAEGRLPSYVEGVKGASRYLKKKQRKRRKFMHLRLAQTVIM